MVSRLMPRMLDGEVLKEIYADILAKDWRPLYKQWNISTVRHVYKKNGILLSDYTSARVTGQKIERRKQHVSEADIANVWANRLILKKVTTDLSSITTALFWYIMRTIMSSFLLFLAINGRKDGYGYD